ncbi:VOC family protein [Micromonospora sp. NPDC020750]
MTAGGHLDADDPARLARFWAGMLGREVVAHAGTGAC